MNVNDFLSKLEHVLETRGGWQARCPSHEDKNPSLSISEREGRILLHCHAGCAPEAITEAVGVCMADLFANTKAGTDHGRIVATYPYTDERGKLLFEVLRYEPKDFRQRRPDDKGGWIWNLNGTRRVLYQLPRVLKAKWVVVVEGEKDAGVAHELGIPATCNPHGAGKWRREHSESLRGKKVVVIADADAPGLAHARNVVKSLMGVAAQVRLIEALPASKDLTEWVGKGGTCEKLLTIIREAQPLSPGDVERWKQSQIPIPGVLASDVQPEAVQWLWKAYIPRGKVTMFDGDPGVGKSTTALDIVARTTTGGTMPDDSGPEVPAAGAVIVSLEDGIADTIVPRFIAAGADLEKIRIIDLIRGDDGTDRTPTIPRDLPAIEQAIQDRDAALLVIDPLVATLGSETNSYKDQDIRRALAPVKVLAERTNVAVIAVRHLNKSNSSNPKYRGGGSIGITGLARANFIFGEDPDEPGTFVMAWSKGNLAAKPTAMKYALEESEHGLHVKWLGMSEHTARTLLAEPQSQEDANAMQGAKEFLLNALDGGPRSVKELQGEARKAGHSERTIDRAKNRLGIKSQKRSFGGSWEWVLPNNAKGAKDATKDADCQNLAPFEQDIETKPFNSNTSSKDAKVVNMAAFEGGDGPIRSNGDSSNPNSWTNHAPHEPVENRSLEGEL